MQNLKMIASLQRELNISEAALFRILGSTRVPVGNGSAAEASSKEYDSGLRRMARGKSTEELFVSENEILESCRSYSSVCSQVYGWLCRGDFSPKKIPDSLSKAKILHACRTAGRLRAEVLRGHSKSKKLN